MENLNSSINAKAINDEVGKKIKKKSSADNADREAGQKTGTSNTNKG